MGSSLRVDNMEVFMQADCSASLDPIPSRACLYNSHANVASRQPMKSYAEGFEFAFSAALTSMACEIPLCSTTDLHQFTALILEGRRLLTTMGQTLWFGLCAYLSLFMILLASVIVDSPPILRAYQVLWLIWVIIPLLSISLLASPRQPEIMRNCPGNSSSIQSFSHLSSRFLSVI
jgi:hypothetical protein